MSGQLFTGDVVQKELALTGDIGYAKHCCTVSRRASGPESLNIWKMWHTYRSGVKNP